MNRCKRYSEIREKLESYRTEIRDLLISLAKIPSVRSSAEPDAPFGAACKAVLSSVQEIQNQFGFVTACHDDSGYLLAYTGNLASTHTIGLFAHADVVPPGDDWHFTTPFNPVEKDGFLIGRGVYDNKSGILMSVYAAKIINDLKLPFHSRLLLFTGSNEESGMADLQAFTRTETIPDISLVPDNGFPLSRGECGIFRWYAVSGMAFSNAVLSFEGGSAFNTVLGTACVVLKYSSEMETFLRDAIMHEKDLHLVRESNTLRLTASGETCHAAAPGDAIHAVYRLSTLLSRCTLLTESDQKIFSAASELTQDCYGTGFGIAENDPDFGRLTCVNGMVSCVEGSLSLSFDCRYGIRHNEKAMEECVLKKLNEICWKYNLHEIKSGYYIPESDPLVKILLNVYRDCSQKYDASSYISRGATYARYLKNAFSMGDPYREIPFPVPSGHGHAHQPDEMLSLDALLDSAAILTEMILACDDYLIE